MNIAAVGARCAEGADLLDEVHRRIAEYPEKSVWIEVFSRGETQRQLEVARLRAEDGIAQPLLGVPFAVKDNIDVAGHPTTAACPAFAYTPGKSATVVERLCAAGAIVIGKTNLDQFATGLVGTRSPYGACANVYDGRYISGGSSSGSAVAVAAGLVSFALGTDTAGSGRVPAGFNNLVGLKPTRGLVSAAGVVPACRSLDCVSIFALDCGDAEAVFTVAAGFDSGDPFSRGPGDLPAVREVPGEGFVFGAPQEQDLRFFGNAAAEAAYAAGVERLQSLGGRRVMVDYTPFVRAASLLYEGPWVAERALVVRDLLRRDPAALLPVTRQIIERGLGRDAMSVFEAQYALAALRQEVRPVWEEIDFLFLPTTGTIYTREEVEADPVGLNTNLGYYTNFVNLMDLCAVAAPNGFQPNGLPVGVQFIGRAGQDREMLRLAGKFHGEALWVH
jgi:allophanate hydrolase